MPAREEAELNIGKVLVVLQNGLNGNIRGQGPIGVDERPLKTR